jgi:glycosyltransferase involved in cell wall biosynthesis
MLTAADQIIVASPELESFCRLNGFDQVTLIPTPVETERFIPVEHRGTNRPIVIGWIGSASNTRHLNIIQPALKSICAAYGARLLLVGAPANFSLPGVPAEHQLWSYETEPILLSQMDIGIMPLDESILYAKGKGGYKLFQYMAAGLPVIASPLGINSDIVEHGQNGFLASNYVEWEKYLTILIEQEEERERLGSNGRKLTEEKYSRDYCSKLLTLTINTLLTL